MILDFFASLGNWNWFILGLVLLGIEVMAPGTFILWLGIAALLTGLLTLVVDIGWQGQLIAFAILSVLAVWGWWRYGRTRRRDASEPVLNRRAELYTGRVFTLEEAIVNGSGRVRIDDTIWRVSGPDMPAGTRVRVVSAQGTVLNVESA